MIIAPALGGRVEVKGSLRLAGQMYELGKKKSSFRFSGRLCLKGVRWKVIG